MISDQFVESLIAKKYETMDFLTGVFNRAMYNLLKKNGWMDSPFKLQGCNLNNGIFADNMLGRSLLNIVNVEWNFRDL